MDLSLAPNAVARADRELKQTRLLRTAGRRGTVVADVDGVPAVERRKRLIVAADRHAAEAQQLGVSLEDAVDALRTSEALRSRQT